MTSPLRPHHKPAIEELLRSTKSFTDEEIACALELVDIKLSTPDCKDYTFEVHEEDGKATGFICYGPVPMTNGTYDLYWIAVLKGTQAKGIGTKLLNSAEENLSRLGAKMFIAETSSQPSYEPTRAFYLKKGFKLETVIKDFYKPGDDRLEYIKRF